MLKQYFHNSQRPTPLKLLEYM